MKIMTQEEMAEIYRQSGIPAASTMASLSQQEPTYEERLRDELAKEIMPSIFERRMMRITNIDTMDAVRREIADQSYAMADAMLQARKQGGE